MKKNLIFFLKDLESINPDQLDLTTGTTGQVACVTAVQTSSYVVALYFVHYGN